MSSTLRFTLLFIPVSNYTKQRNTALNHKKWCTSPNKDNRTEFIKYTLLLAKILLLKILKTACDNITGKPSRVVADTQMDFLINFLSHLLGL